MQQSQYVKGKGQILSGYVAESKKFYSSLAGRGFSYEPGFSYDALNGLETETKFKLSDLNYSILEAEVARELKQRGLDYDIAYKTAAIQWEIDKATLFSEWDKELSMIRREMSFDEETVTSLAIEVSKRGNLLIAAKAAIELEIEGIKKQIQLLDSDTSSYEVALANAKMLTAQKKLEILPYISALIEIENRITIKDQTLHDKIVLLTDKERLLIDEHRDIAVLENEIAEVTGDLVTKLFEALEMDSVLIQKGYDIVSSMNSLYSLMQLVVDSDQTIALEKIALSSKEDLLTAAKNIEIQDRASILTIDSNIINSEAMISGLKGMLLTQELANEAARTQVITLQGATILQETDNIAFETSLLPQKTALVNAEIPIITQESLILSTTANVVAAETQVINSEALVVSQESAVAAMYPALLQTEQNIAVINKDISTVMIDIAKEKNRVIAHEYNLLTARNNLVSTSMNTVNEIQNLLSIESTKDTFGRTLVAHETAYSQMVLADMVPVIDSLVSTIDNHILEISNQVALELQITNEQLNTMASELTMVAKQQDVIIKKNALLSALQRLNTAIDSFTVDKLTRVSSANAGLVVAYNQKIISNNTQATLRQAISDVQKQIALLTPQKSLSEQTLLTSELTKNTANNTLRQIEQAQRLQAINHDIDMATQEMDGFINYKTDWDIVKTAIDTGRQNTFSTVYDNKKTEVDTEFNSKISNATITEAERRRVAIANGMSEIDKITQITNSKINTAGVTARLTHLLL